jgi:hypothetical protein
MERMNREQKTNMHDVKMSIFQFEHFHDHIVGHKQAS